MKKKVIKDIKKLSIKGFIVKYKIGFFVTLLFSFLVYGIKLVCYSISIDTEAIINDYQGIINSWYSINRFSLGIIKYLLHLEPFNYYMANGIMIIFLALSVFLLFYIVYSNINREVSNKEIILFSGLIISSPILVEQFNFTLQCAEVAISFFIFDIGLFIFLKSFNKKYLLIFSIICFAFCLGTYQMFMTLLMAMFIVILLLRNEDDYSKKDNIGYGVMAVIVVISSFVVYSLFGNMVNDYLQISNTSYLGEQINWLSKPFYINFIKLLGYVGKVFIGYDIFYNCSYFLMFLVLGYKFYHNRERKFYSVLCLISLISPFLLAFLLGHSEVVRAQMPLAVIIAVILIFVPSFSLKQNKLKYQILLILVIISQFITVEWMLISDYIRYKEDEKIAFNVMEGYSENNGNVLVFVGYHDYSNKKFLLRGETIGASFFEWDKDSSLGVNKRAIEFINTLGYDVKMPTLEQYKLAKEIVEYKSCYLETGEIIEKQELFIIKLC